ncbi:MAG: hypothetical protein IKS51_01825 [Erysipelotrichaceae bacterium]|nr:hypothetical protein [Erysipelotrichaceae bacterium]
MKTRTIIKTKASNDIEAIFKAQELLMETARKQPFCKHTITVELSNGKLFQMWIAPHQEPIYTA